MERLIKELDKDIVLTEVEYIDIDRSVLLHIEYDKSFISRCPECGQPAVRKNGSHERNVKDLPIMGRMIVFWTSNGHGEISDIKNRTKTT